MYVNIEETWARFPGHFIGVRLTLASKVNATQNQGLSYDVGSGSEKMPCNNIDKPLVVYRFSGNMVTSIAMLRTQ